MDIVNILSKIPATIWGVIIGSSLTLFGTFLQGKTALKLLLKQKNYDEKNAQKNRDFDLKKNNYLESLKGLTQLINVLIEFTKPGRNFDDFGKEVQKLFVQLCTVDLVAEKETLEPLHKFQKYYFKVCMDLMNEKIPYESLVIDKKLKKDWYDYFSKRIDENISLINNNPYKGTDNEQDHLSFLNESYQDFCKERNKYSDELNQITRKLLKVEIDFKRKVVEKVLMMNQFLTEYIQSARNDLGLKVIPIESAQVNAFHEIARDSIEKIFEAVEIMNKEEETARQPASNPCE